MYTHFRTALLIYTIGVVTPTHAQLLASTVDSDQQSARDSEKLTILQAELSEQKQLAANLQQTRAVQLAGANKTELDKTESRLEEVISNIAQLQQEIDVAQGRAKAAKTIVVKPVNFTKPDEVKTAKSGESQAVPAAGPWCDLYNRQSAVTPR
ncbi:conserved exported hypothetical protein [Candidatus Methylobacter favarea]|uniref:YbgF trimerisation domain-containing protein n=1 Tax=Candidatus Methylobacter favarea TaxID=2707345 RepID=A0A8S0Y6M6_9GAMM|nr:hypothetical protein [Candidatus Methylobacter favarea]CAA9891707.1 conserved exported hypothetical protein [Candidatus Methylobacter favarea]